MENACLDKYEKLTKMIFNKYFLYGVVLACIASNLFIFPDILNNKDIKLFEMSYLIPEFSSQYPNTAGNKPQVKEKDQEIILTLSLSSYYYIFLLIGVLVCAIGFAIAIIKNYHRIRDLIQRKCLDIKIPQVSGYELLED